MARIRRMAQTKSNRLRREYTKNPDFVKLLRVEESTTRRALKELEVEPKTAKQIEKIESRIRVLRRMLSEIGHRINIHSSDLHRLIKDSLELMPILYKSKKTQKQEVEGIEASLKDTYRQLQRAENQINSARPVRVDFHAQELGQMLLHINKIQQTSMAELLGEKHAEYKKLLSTHQKDEKTKYGQRMKNRRERMRQENIKKQREWLNNDPEKIGRMH